ncbi:hypothetical protein IMSHALPRED_003317 [Imshaugia aleurites]|uniref:WLM domain-containing protein n=1 Tax=Imshaugia aleurites TaxID=172621 RepID=A0A8H3F9V1_9LECA|nr:hypothetical protein IMSHALPRED_003317 [Imshaugia aleurites]
MPLGIQRLNAPHPQSSSHITFIKPLVGPHAPHALDFLERIAAISHPILASAHLSITTLEEHEPNREFVGRNFNNGEVIQLVLRTQQGRWLSFRSVQLVMMHEVAHCVEMNHGRGFWAVRERFVGELRALWARGYTGDGMWGRGRTLLSGEYDEGGRAGEEGLPARVCGGMFRSGRGGKRRRRRREETWAEGRERRVRKKFGVGGVVLGGDEEVKGKLEKGGRAKGKPRVAGSLRGRELRAAAALARFEVKKEEEEEEQVEDEKWMLSGSETESGDEEVDVKGEAFDIDGSRMRDGKGRGLVKVCEDEDQDDVHVKQEIEELQGLHDVGIASPWTTAARDQTTVDRTESHRADSRGAELGQLSKSSHMDPPDRIRMEDIPQYVEKENRPSAKQTKAVQINVHTLLHANKDTSNGTASQTSNLPVKAPIATPEILEIICPICSMSNGPGSLLCIACSHVLDTSKITRYWQCRSDVCQGGQYINAGDCGRCGVCGARNDDGEV